jgi:predicted O-linked N-acetylglucosamine transferase (SPINDLY family)
MVKKAGPTRDAALEVAVALQNAGRQAEAEAAYRAILRLRPTLAPALSNLSVILRKTGRLAEARRCLEAAVQNHPRHAASWSNLTNVYSDLNLKREAVDAGRQAVLHAPGQARPLGVLGWALWKQDSFDEARQCMEESLAIQPRDALNWNNLGNVHQRQCNIGLAIECYRRALEIDPGLSMAMQNIAFCMHFTDDYSPQDIAQAHRDWAARFEAARGPALTAPPPMNLAKPRLRVGFMSPDFRDHPVAAFFRPLIRHWPRERFELWFYSEVRSPDAVTNWLRQRADGWVDTPGLDDSALAHRIRADGIDILVDLCGHTGGSRLLAMAHRPAPVQVSWLGYFDTTGMKSVDFLMADTVCVQPGDEPRFTETVVRLPDDFVCYEPPSVLPRIGPLPADSTGHFTFGSQNQLVKLTPRVIGLWARIVNAVPGSRLLLAGRALNDASTCERFAKDFESQGLARTRLELRPSAPQQSVLAAYNEIDLALDPFPCAGGTTTCEALVMGVPVLSLFGDRFAGRHSAAHLQAAGLGEFVVHSEEAYAARAVALATQPEPLRQLRSSLRENLPQTHLCDGIRFSSHFASALEVMWACKAKQMLRN